MSNADKTSLPDRDRDRLKQEAIRRYKQLQNRQRYELTLDDQLFLENFKSAMCLLWGFQNQS